MLHKSENFPVVILRFFLVFGPHQKKDRLIPYVIDSCRKNKKFKTTNGEQYRDFCYISDVVEAIIKTIKTKNIDGEIINIGSGIKIKVKDIINKIVKKIGKGKPLFGKLKHRKNENKCLYANIAKAKKLLNWKPKIRLVEGLDRTIDYYK